MIDGDLVDNFGSSCSSLHKCSRGILYEKRSYREGYGDDIHAWAIYFWLGIFGYLYVKALPDKILQSQNQQIIDLMRGGKNEQMS